MTKLSLALIAKNESRCLARCLRSVETIVDEIVVVDTGSTDATVAIAQEFNAKVSQFTWSNDFSAARNHALDQTTGEWILVLDADEHAGPALSREIRDFIGGHPTIGRLRVISEFRQSEEILRSQSFVSRLFPRGARFQGRIHEQLMSSLPRVNLKGELWHDGYLDTIKSDRNARLLMRELQDSPRDPYLLFQLALEYTSLKQEAKACQCLADAFTGVRLDEPFAPNLVVDYLYALTKLKKFEIGLELIERTSVALQDFPDFHLACGLFYMQLVRSNTAKYVSYLPRIESSFKRCLALGETDKYKSVQGSGSFLAHYNLGTLYHVFGDQAAASRSFEQSASLGYEPAAKLLQQLGTPPPTGLEGCR